MIVYKKISLQDKALFDFYLGKDFFYISDINFTNLYIWRNAREIAYAIVNECLVIKTTYTGKTPYYFYPIGANEEDKIACIQKMIQDCQTKNEPLEFQSLEKKSVEILQNFFGKKFNFKSNPNRNDYVYDTKELIKLSGRKFHKKKNHLNRFLQNYPDFTYTSIDKNNKELVKKVWGTWFKQLKENGEISQGLANENAGINDILKDYEYFNLKGGFISAEEKIVAFSFGEAINDEMVVIHIEKANSYYQGSYQIINQQLLLNEFSEYKYINREEDLGIEGLRQAKMSYNPIFLVEKFEGIFQK